ncbi:MAG: phosphatase PAP2 family protein [Gemmatimonadota bacterium]|nr:phosphatase PAP2 family protein [Gemmatimonadota bacterium]
MPADSAPINPHIPRDSNDRRDRPRGRFPRFWNLIFDGMRRAGLDAKSFYTTVGIFLTVGAIIAIAATAAFAELAEHVLAGGTQAFDVAILQWLHAHQSKPVTALMVEMTYLGTGTVVIVIVGVAALFLWHTEHKHSARLLLAATIGNILLNGVLKLVYHRARPSVFEWQVTAVSSSFPSGHAMSATVVYGTVAYLLMRLQKHQWAKALTLFAAVFLILLICLTRLYLGVHYPSDVIGGIIVGLGWASFCMATLEASLVLARRRAPRDVIEERRAPSEVPAAEASAR